jgi:hypothetical protein
MVDVVLAVLAGPLLAAGLAKLAVPASRLNWPYQSGLLAAPRGPRLVGAAELVAVVVLVLAPGPWDALCGFVAYAALAVVAFRLRGQSCACFGAARLAAVGSGHLALNAVGASAAVAVFLLPTARPWPAGRAVGAVLVAGIVAGVLWLLDRRKPPVEAACDTPIVAVRLYESSSCPACRSLERLLGSMADDRRNAVDTTVLQEGENLPDRLSGLGVPCAIGVDAGGNEVCEPVSGVGEVKALIDRITVRNDARVG